MHVDGEWRVFHSPGNQGKVAYVLVQQSVFRECIHLYVIARQLLWSHMSFLVGGIEERNCRLISCRVFLAIRLLVLRRSRLLGLVLSEVSLELAAEVDERGSNLCLSILFVVLLAFALFLILLLSHVLVKRLDHFAVILAESFLKVGGSLDHEQ